MTKGKAKKPAPRTGKPRHQLAAISWPWNVRQTLVATAMVIAAGAMLTFWRYIFGGFLFLFEDIGSDTITMFYPNLVHMARYYQEVGFPGWSFYLGPGNSIYPGGLSNPWDWIYFLMDAKTIARSLGVMQMLKLISAGTIFALFLRKLEVSPPVILIGAVLYAFGGYMVVGSGWYVHTTHIFWITVALLGFEMLLRDQKWWLFPIPFFFLAGTRGYFLILFMALYALVRTVDYYGWDVKKLLRVYGRMAVCGVMALVLTAPFLSGKVTKLINSPRVTGKVAKQEMLSDKPVFELAQAKHNATAILRWFSSDVIGTGDAYKGWRNYLEGPLFYIGLISLLLLPQFFVLAQRRQRWWYGALLLFWIWLILFPWFRYAFYAFAGNYYKGALSLFIPFTVLLMALLALDQIVKGKPLHLMLLGGTLLLCLLALWYPYAALPEGIQPAIQTRVSIFLVGGALALAAMNYQTTRRFALPVLVVLSGVEAVWFSCTSNNTRVAVPSADLDKPVRHFDETLDALDWIRQQPGPLFYRTDKVYGSVKTGYNDALVQGFFGTKMYQSHNSKYYVQFLEDMGVIPKGNEASSRWLVGVSKRSFLHPLMSTQYVLTRKETKSDVNKDIYTNVHTAGPIEVMRNNFFIPFGIPFSYFFTESDFLTLDSGQKLEAIYHGIVVPDAATGRMQGIPRIRSEEVTYGGPVVAGAWRQLARDAMQMTSFDHNHITGTIDLKKPSVLFFSLVYDEAWHVYVDGEERELMLVDIGFSGVKLDPGKHEIELKYIPPMSRAGWIIFAVGLAIYGLMLYKKVKLFPIA